MADETVSLLDWFNRRVEAEQRDALDAAAFDLALECGCAFAVAVEMLRRSGGSVTKARKRLGAVCVPLPA